MLLFKSGRILTWERHLNKYLEFHTYYQNSSHLISAFSASSFPFWEVCSLCLVGCHSPTTGEDTWPRTANMMTPHLSFLAYSNWSICKDPNPRRVSLLENDMGS